MRHVNPDERSTAALFMKALEIDSIVESLSTPGIYASGLGFQQVLSSLRGPFALLKEDGEDIRNQPLPRDAAYVLSDHLDLSGEEEKSLMAFDPLVLNVGPRSLHSNQCITIVNNELDRRESLR